MRTSQAGIDPEALEEQLPPTQEEDDFADYEDYFEVDDYEDHSVPYLTGTPQ